MAVTRFSPQPGNYGETYTAPGVTIPGAFALTSAGITRLYLPTTLDRLWLKGALLAFTVAIPTGTVGLSVKIQKRQVGGTFIDVTTPVSALARSLFEQIALTPLAGIAEGSFMLQPGEFFCLTFDNTGGTVTVSPSGLVVAAKLAVLR